MDCIALESRLSPRMPRRLAIPIVLVVAILCASFGLTRLRFDTDILSMLPGDLPEVKGLKAFHEAFSRDDELILVIEGSEQDAGSLSEAAESLGKQLATDGVAKQTRWKPRWNQEPQGIAELLAYLWLNGDPSPPRRPGGWLPARPPRPLANPSPASPPRRRASRW